MKIDPPLYAIYDAEVSLRHNISLINFLEAFYEGGGRILQYRDKIHSSWEIKNLISPHIHFIKKLNQKKDPFFFIINDFSDLSYELGLSLHLGQSDELTQEMKTKLSNSSGSLIWGRSTHNEKEILSVIHENPQADYIGFGPVFPTKTKNIDGSSFHLIRDTLNLWKKPIVWIGGINIENVAQLPQSNRFFYAIISDFFRFGNKKEDIKRYTKNFIDSLKKN